MYEIGVMTSSLGIENPIEAVKKAKELGFKKVQLTGLDFDDNFYLARGKKELMGFLESCGVEVSSLSVKYNQKEDSPYHLWLMKEHVRLAYRMGVKLVTGHIGKISEKRGLLLEQMKQIACLCNDADVYFGIETGTEPPWDLIRFIDSVDGQDTNPHIAVNFDPANFLIYGSLDADEIAGSISMLKCRIKQVHVKDAVPGKEVSLGEGSVNIRDYVMALQKINYDGPLILERGGAQEEKLAEIKKEKIFLENILENSLVERTEKLVR